MHIDAERTVFVEITFKLSAEEAATLMSMNQNPVPGDSQLAKLMRQEIFEALQQVGVKPT